MLDNAGRGANGVSLSGMAAMTKRNEERLVLVISSLEGRVTDMRYAFVLE